MKFIIKGRKMDVTEALDETIRKKLGKLSKFFDDEAEVNVTLSVQRGRSIVETTIYSKGILYRAENNGDDMYALIDHTADVIERQILKNKTRLAKRLKASAFTPSKDREKVEEEHEFNIVRTKHHSVKPMSAEEAILQMNLLGHEFYVFKNDESMDMGIVYKRKDGNYGLIEVD